MQILAFFVIFYFVSARICDSKNYPFMDKNNPGKFENMRFIPPPLNLNDMAKLIIEGSISIIDGCTFSMTLTGVSSAQDRPLYATLYGGMGSDDKSEMKLISEIFMLADVVKLGSLTKTFTLRRNVSFFDFNQFRLFATYIEKTLSVVNIPSAIDGISTEPSPSSTINPIHSLSPT